VGKEPNVVEAIVQLHPSFVQASDYEGQFLLLLSPTAKIFNTVIKTLYEFVTDVYISCNTHQCFSLNICHLVCVGQIVWSEDASSKDYDNNLISSCPGECGLRSIVYHYMCSELDLKSPRRRQGTYCSTSSTIRWG
jgi:hypothetical protein